MKLLNKYPNDFSEIGHRVQQHGDRGKSNCIDMQKRITLLKVPYFDKYGAFLLCYYFTIIECFSSELWLEQQDRN